MTPMTIPKRVNAERSLCAQIAETASFRVSMNFTEALLVRAWPLYCCSRPQSSSEVLFPAKRLNGIEAGGFPGRPEPEDYSYRSGDSDSHCNCPQWYIGRQRRVLVHEQARDLAQSQSRK